MVSVVQPAKALRMVSCTGYGTATTRLQDEWGIQALRREDCAILVPRMCDFATNSCPTGMLLESWAEGWNTEPVSAEYLYEGISCWIHIACCLHK